MLCDSLSLIPCLFITIFHVVPVFKNGLPGIQNIDGWQIGLRFDPLIYHDHYEKNYLALFETVFSQIDVNGVHSVSAGIFRMPEKFFRNMIKLYPKEKMFASVANENKKMASYTESLENEMMNFCKVNILKYIPQHKYFPCL